MEARLELAGCVWFRVSALVGFGLALGAVSLGPLLLLPLGLVALLLVSSGLFLLVARLQQGGENLDARPWLGIGLVLALTGLVGHARRGD
jgi:hypothetical protein